MARGYTNGYVRISRPDLSLREQRRLELKDWNRYRKPKKKKKHRPTKKQRVKKSLQAWFKEYEGYSYRKLLFTQEWKVFRIKILKRDKYKCTECGSKQRLQVHHIKYGDYMFPWVVKDSWVTTLCYKCHKAIHTKS